LPGYTGAALKFPPYIIIHAAAMVLYASTCDVRSADESSMKHTYTVATALSMTDVTTPMMPYPTQKHAVRVDRWRDKPKSEATAIAIAEVTSALSTHTKVRTTAVMSSFNTAPKSRDRIMFVMFFADVMKFEPYTATYTSVYLLK